MHANMYTQVCMDICALTCCCFPSTKKIEASDSEKANIMRVLDLLNVSGPAELEEEQQEEEEEEQEGHVVLAPAPAPLPAHAPLPALAGTARTVGNICF